MRGALLAAVLGATVVALAAAPASAQIYAWQDPTGAWVLSDQHTAAGARTFAVPKSPAYRATRPATGMAAASFEPLIQAHATRAGLSPDLVRAVIQVESAFNPRARSPKGAMGLMQLMPATAAELGVRQPYDPAENIAGGTTYLRGLLDRFEGNVALALAAYNAGPAAVERHGRAVPPYAETTRYVAEVGRVSGSATGASGQAVSAGTPRPGRRTSPAPAAPASVIYRVMDVIDGRPMVRYTTERPESGAYEVVQR